MRGRYCLACTWENWACWHLHTSLALFCSVKSQRRNYFSLHSTFTGSMRERERSICRRTPYSAILRHYLPVHSTSDVRTVFLNSQTRTQKQFYHNHLHWNNNIKSSINFTPVAAIICRSQWPRGLRRRFSAARLLRLWVRIPPEAWMFVCCECCVLSGRGLCDGLIMRPEESYQLWRVVVCDQKTSKTRRLKPAIRL